jgi:hypothetical protein
VKHFPTRLTALCLGLAVLAPAVAQATAPAIVRRDGTIVNLDTGLAVRRDGSHYVMSPQALRALEQVHAQRRFPLPHPHKGIPHRPEIR